MKIPVRFFSPHFAGIAIGGGLGAIARLAVFTLVDETLIKVLICNIIGSFVYSVASELSDRLPPDLRTLITSGFCGGLSIFATFSKDSVRSLQSGATDEFFANIFANFVLCVIAVFAASAIVRRIRCALKKRNKAREEAR